MIHFGTMGKPSATLGYRNNIPHAVVVVAEKPTGNIWIAHVTHSSDYYAASIQMTRQDFPSAFCEKGGPLTDEKGVLGLIEKPDIPCHVQAIPISPNSYTVNNTLITMDNVVVFTDTEKTTLKNHITTAITNYQEQEKAKKEIKKKKKR